MSPIEKKTIYTLLIFIFSFVSEMVHKSEGLEFISLWGRNFLPGHNIQIGLGVNLALYKTNSLIQY